MTYRTAVRGLLGGCLGLLLFASAFGFDRLPAWNASKLAGTGGAPMPLHAIPLHEHLPWAEALHFVPVPGAADHALVVERFGSVWLLDARAGTRSLFLQLSPDARQKRKTSSGIAFHPDYPQNPRVYLHWHEKVGSEGWNRISEFQVDGSADLHSRRDLLEWKANGHNGGDLRFGPDGMLYITSGDGASPGDPENVGQLTDDLLAAMLRIDVDGQDGGKAYRIPPDNPFINEPGVTPETWAYGLRNPWRISFHPQNGELWLGDNGDEDWEMVHRIERGANYGWSAFEGGHIFRRSNRLAGPTRVHSLPVVEHPHSDMRSVIGGFWYRGNAMPEWKGTYIYGCYFTGKIWGFKLIDGKPTAPRRLADTRAAIVAVVENEDHEPIVVSMDRGLFTLKPSLETETPRPIPSRLSETGLFASTAEHRVAKGLLPYEINAPMFWDGAERQRFIGLPEGEKIIVQHKPPGMSSREHARVRNEAGLDRWRMPGGAVLMQTFSTAGKRIETQVSFKDGGEWRFLTYHWRDQQDAELVPEEGRTETLTTEGADPKTWRFPARVDCKACHTQRSMFVPGINFSQLNREMDYRAFGGGLENQLDAFQRLGFFRPNYKIPEKLKPLKMPNPHDPTLAVAVRARAYLHVNCTHCHRETGLGGRASFQLLHWLPEEDLGLFDARPMVGLPGIDPALARLIAPGAPERSEIYRRMVSATTGRMPLLGGSEIDWEGAALMRQWIEGMDAPPEEP